MTETNRQFVAVALDCMLRCVQSEEPEIEWEDFALVVVEHMKKRVKERERQVIALAALERL
jgi:hypothetical protein